MIKSIWFDKLTMKDLPPDFLLDEVIEKNRKRREEHRLRVVEKILTAD